MFVGTKGVHDMVTKGPIIMERTKRSWRDNVPNTASPVGRPTMPGRTVTTWKASSKNTQNETTKAVKAPLKTKSLAPVKTLTTSPTTLLLGHFLLKRFWC